MNDPKKDAKSTQSGKKSTHQQDGIDLPEEIKRIRELEEELSAALQKIDELEVTLQEVKNRELRAVADVQNIRRRTEEERGKLLFESGRNILNAILPSLDNFDLAMRNLPEDLKNNEWVAGIINIEKQMYGLLQKEGLEEITEVDVELDPTRHEAVMVDTEGKKGRVTNVLQKGFLFHGKVLRVARVAVGGG